MFIPHKALHIFHYDNGVVHQQPDSQHHAEHCQRINGKSRRIKYGQDAEQNNRNGNGRNDGGPQALHEKKHDDHNERDGFK